MFLLILKKKEEITMLLSSFTFHNVSINTLAHPTAQTSHISLHSTMFLLIRHHHTEIVHDLKNFTFHNVSINTTETSTRMEMWLDFTFHNVSINTEQKKYNGYQLFASLHSTMFLLILCPSSCSISMTFLYIPQCFY